MATAASSINKNVFTSDQWPELPQKIISREGYEVDVSGERWRLPIVGRAPELNFERIKSRRLAWAVKAHVIDRIQRISISAGNNAFETVLRRFLLAGDGFNRLGKN